MVKKRVRLNESALRNIIRKCVMEAVSEIDRLSNYDDDFGYDFIEGNEDTPRSVRKEQMNADFGMKALKGDKFAKTLRRNTPQGWVDAAKDSKID